MSLRLPPFEKGTVVSSQVALNCSCDRDSFRVGFRGLAKVDRRVDEGSPSDLSTSSRSELSTGVIMELPSEYTRER